MAEIYAWDYHFVLHGVSHYSGKWTWGIEWTSFPSLECEGYNNLFVNT
jgi:hypothetical protein